MSSWYFLPLYFQAVLGASPTRSGVLILPIILVQATVGVGAGTLIRYFGRYRELILVGTLLMTLGFGLFTRLDSSTPLTTIVIFQIVAGLGVGSVFQAPLIAYQANVVQQDTSAATALFGFVRSLSTSISVVIGGIVFQNGIASQTSRLQQALGPEVAQNFSATSATSSAIRVKLLPLDQRELVKQVYVKGLQDMWILYTTAAGVALLAGLFIKNRTLSDTSDVAAPGTSATDGSAAVELTER